MTDLDLEILLDHSRMYRAVVARVAARQTGDLTMAKNLTLHTPLPWHVVDNGFKTQFIYGSDTTQKKSPMGIAYNELVAGGDGPFTLNAANAAFIVNACNAHDALVDALAGMVDMYVAMIDSGDAGNWDPETDKEVISARLALSLAKGES